MAEWATIRSEALTARINPLGAELSSLTDADGRELMTDADPAFWTGRAPLLFPIVGALAGDTLRLGGQDFTMAKHGLARRLPFSLVDQSASEVVFRLGDDMATRAAYPFAFRLDAGFRINGATLAVTVTIANPGDAPLPASFGFHPAFAWPLPYGRDRADHRIVFDADEGEDIRVLDAAGLVSPERRASPLDGRVLALGDALFERDALIWNAVRSQRVTYGASDGPQLEVAFPDTPKLGIWTKPGAAFICIEPWHGIADPQGYAGDFRDKPGVFDVAPGDEKRIEMRVTLIP